MVVGKVVMLKVRLVPIVMLVVEIKAYSNCGAMSDEDGLSIMIVM